MAYSNITTEQRNSLQYLLNLVVKPLQKDIAKVFGKDRTAIFREVKRNGENGEYNSSLAKQKAKERRVQAHAKCRKIENSKWLRSYIIAKLKLTWSPDQIAGRLKLEYGKTIVSKDTIYTYVYNNKDDEGNKLTIYLRFKNNRYRRTSGSKQRAIERKEIDNKKSIDDRPIVIGNHDYEGDYIMLDRLSGIINFTNRRHKLVKLIYAIHNQEWFERSVYEIFKDLPIDSLTIDNDKSYARYEFIERNLKIDIFFAHPYHFWERGLNENFNGLIREFFTKKQKYVNINVIEVKRKLKLIETLLNNRPRKCLGYLTPLESYRKAGCCTQS